MSNACDLPWYIDLASAWRDILRILIAWVCLLFTSLPVFAQNLEAPSWVEQLGAIELATFQRTYGKDALMPRIKRLENNYFPQPSEQEQKDLDVRIAELMDRAQPSQTDMQNAAADCAQPLQPVAKAKSFKTGPPPLFPKTTKSIKEAGCTLRHGVKRVLTSKMFWATLAGAGAVTGAYFLARGSNGKVYNAAGDDDRYCSQDFNCHRCKSCDGCGYCNNRQAPQQKCGVWQILVQQGLKEP